MSFPFAALAPEPVGHELGHEYEDRGIDSLLDAAGESEWMDDGSSSSAGPPQKPFSPRRRVGYVPRRGYPGRWDTGKGPGWIKTLWNSSPMCEAMRLGVGYLKGDWGYECRPPSWHDPMPRLMPKEPEAKKDVVMEDRPAKKRKRDANTFVLDEGYDLSRVREFKRLVTQEERVLSGRVMNTHYHYWNATLCGLGDDCDKRKGTKIHLTNLTLRLVCLPLAKEYDAQDEVTPFRTVVIGPGLVRVCVVCDTQCNMEDFQPLRVFDLSKSSWAADPTKHICHAPYNKNEFGRYLILADETRVTKGGEFSYLHRPADPVIPAYTETNFVHWKVKPLLFDWKLDLNYQVEYVGNTGDPSYVDIMRNSTWVMVAWEALDVGDSGIYWHHHDLSEQPYQADKTELRVEGYSTTDYVDS